MGRQIGKRNECKYRREVKAWVNVGTETIRTSSIQLDFIVEVKERMDQEGRRQGGGLKQ